MRSNTTFAVTMCHASRRLSRRRFLKRSIVGSLGLIAAVAYTNEPNTRIKRIELFEVRYPTKGYFKFFIGPRGAYGRGAVIVKIIADDGHVGWGQSIPSPLWSYETLETTTIVLQDYLGPILIGRDPLDIDGAHKAMDGALAPGFSTAMPIARSGLDMALHDLAGKLRGQSLSQMWQRAAGGPVTLSWTVNARTLQEAEAVINAGYQSGYSNFNIKVAPDPKFDVQLARLVRQLAPKGFLCGCQRRLRRGCGSGSRAGIGRRWCRCAGVAAATQPYRWVPGPEKAGGLAHPNGRGPCLAGRAFRVYPS